MRHWILAGLAVCLAGGVIAHGQRFQQARTEGGPVDLSTKNVSYAVGYDIGRKYQNLEVEVNPNQLVQGLRAALTDMDPRMSEKRISRTLKGFRRKLLKKRRRQQQQQLQQQSKAGEQFLKKNGQKPGVKVTDSGLQYKVLRRGSGPPPGASDRVTVHYTGKLLSGKVFDSSRKRGKPTTLRVDQVIPGWTEAMQMMKPGAKYRLWIPSDLAYGDKGVGQVIKPGATLVFTVELLNVSRR